MTDEPPPKKRPVPIAATPLHAGRMTPETAAAYLAKKAHRAAQEAGARSRAALLHTRHPDAPTPKALPPRPPSGPIKTITKAQIARGLAGIKLG